MDCEHFRQAISARIDGEDPGIGAGMLDRHVAGCGACRAWEATAVALTRTIRVRPAEDLPDLSTPIMIAIAADATGTRGASAVRGHEAPAVIRSTLGLIAAASARLHAPASCATCSVAPMSLPVRAGMAMRTWAAAMRARVIRMTAGASWARPACAARLSAVSAAMAAMMGAARSGRSSAGRTRMLLVTETALASHARHAPQPLRWRSSTPAAMPGSSPSIRAEIACLKCSQSIRGPFTSVAGATCVVVAQPMRPAQADRRSLQLVARARRMVPAGRLRRPAIGRARPYCASALRRPSISSSRARATRDRMVPIGQAHTVAASW